MKHTPGPWKIRADLAITAYDTETEEHQPIARAFGDGSCETLFANTRLISAAPDMLAELTHITNAYAQAMKNAGVTHYPEALAEVRKARAAIAKATGEEL